MARSTANVSRRPGFILNADGQCIHVNCQLVNLLGCTKDCFKCDWATLLHPRGTSFLTELQTAAQTVGWFRFHHRLGAGARYLTTTIRALYDADRTTVIGYGAIVRPVKVLHQPRAATA